MAVHVGDHGKAMTPLQPQGFVLVHGERYDARAEFGPIEPGAEVVVVAGDHMGLVVRALPPGTEPRLPRHGERVRTSYDERVTEESEREEAERQTWIDEHRRSGMTTGAVVGSAAAAVAVWLLWGFIQGQTDDPWAAAAITVGAGALWGVAMFRGLDDALGQVDHNFRRVTTPSACLGVIGTSAGAVLALPPLGLVGGLAVALAATVVLAAVLPVFLLLTGLGGE
ncbi:MAG TPA: NfeD family protein [Fimbriiglobus sp.]|jgi:hypothetical protein|nr:NfeD family protein [Fimbriiglobus sp.]